MSEPGFVGPEKTVPAKKPISPARNIVGLIVLFGVLAFGWFEYMPKRGFNAAVQALQAKTPEDANDLLTMQEAETLIGKNADGPAVDFNEGARELTKKTYTWNGLLKHYTLTAHYSKEKNPHLIEFKTDGATLEPAPTATLPSSATTGGGGSTRKGASGKGGGGGAGKKSTSSDKGAADSKATPPSPHGKAAAPNPAADDKAATPKAKPADEKAPKEKTATPSSDAEKDKAKPADGDSPKPKPSE